MSKQLDRARDQITNTVFLSTKAEVTEYYKDAYGAKSWTSRIAKDLHGMIKNKKGENMSVANIQRRFQGGRELKAATQSKTKGEFAALGKTLPPIRTLKHDTITVTVRGTQKGGTRKGKQRPDRARVFTIAMNASQSQAFADNPTWDLVWDAYGGFSFGDYDDDGELQDDEGLDINPDYVLSGVSVSAA
jgi:hypothetical protein